MQCIERGLAVSFLPVSGGAPQRAAIVTRRRGRASRRRRAVARGHHVTRRRALFFAALISLVSGAVLALGEGYLRIKAALASVLIDQALDRYLADGDAHPPWPWADMHPVGELRCERLGVREPVLSGASGESMAFAIGHLTGTAGPNQYGNCVLAGHRDTRMNWLDDVRFGDRLVMRTYDGERSYVVVETDVVDRHDLYAVAPTGNACLTLVTCYPLDAVFPGDDRFVVRAALSPLAPTASSSWGERPAH